jgi:hypothetical protein
MRRRRTDPEALQHTPATPEELARFDDERADHDRTERRLLWKEVVTIAVVVAFVVARQLWWD